jgi:hypothetical protein
MLSIQIQNKVYQFPENWNELSKKQLIGISSILMKEELQHSDRLKLFRICIGMSKRKFFGYAYMPKWLHGSLWMKKAEVLLFIERHLYWLDFLTTTNTLTNKLVPKICYGWKRKKLYGPAANFENLKMDEFCYSEHHYLQYIKTKSKEDLLNFVASIYRPGKANYDRTLNKDGDIRQPFNENLISFYSKRIRKVDHRTLIAILHIYEGCRFAMIETFPKVFDGKESELQTFGLFSLITGVAEDGVMGDFEKVQQKYVQVVLLRLTELINKAEHMEKELEKQKNKIR